MSVSEPFIRRPIATALLMAALLGFGIICYQLLPVSALPNVEFPTISVSAQLPGASPATMADTVATPLEEEFTAIPGLSFMSSSSGLGSTSITLQFALTTDINADAQFVQTAINEAGGVLPKTLPTPPTYRETNPAQTPVLIYAIHSDAMPLYQIDQYANVMLAEQLSTVSGVGQVIIAGQQQPAVHIEVNPQQLAELGIGLSQVATALTDATVDAAKGNLEGSRTEYPLDANDQLFDAAQFQHVIVAYSNGAPVELKDIGQVINSSVSPRTGSWFGTTPCELLLIELQPGANTIQVVDQIEAMLPKLEASIPRAVKVDLVSDRSANIRASVTDVEFTLALTVGLVVLVIFAFLRKLWATIIPSITLPLVIIATFSGMYFLGYSVDNLSLDGADHLGRLSRRRRDRDDREHRALHRGRRPAARGRAQGRRADRIYDHLDDVVADRGVHPAAVHVGGGGPAVPRIRDDGDSDPDLFGAGVSDPDADDVRAISDARGRDEKAPPQPVRARLRAAAQTAMIAACNGPSATVCRCCC